MVDNELHKTIYGKFHYNVSLLYCYNRNNAIYYARTQQWVVISMLSLDKQLYSRNFFTKKRRRRYVYLPEIVSPMILFEDMPAEPFWHLQSSALITHLIFSPDVNKDWISLKEAICFLLGWSFTQMLFWKVYTFIPIMSQENYE